MSLSALCQLAGLNPLRAFRTVNLCNCKWRCEYRFREIIEDYN